MSNFPMQTLSFEGQEIIVTDINGIRWLRGDQIRTTLKIAPTTFKRLFKAHRSEFTDQMTAVVEINTGGGRQLTRLFSPRGAALVALLARSDKAAAFRAWVLTALEATPTAPVPALPALPTPDRAARFLTPEARALLRYHGLGLSGPEIAKLLDKSPKTISRWRSDLRAAGFLGQVQHG